MRGDGEKLRIQRAASNLPRPSVRRAAQAPFWTRPTVEHSSRMMPCCIPVLEEDSKRGQPKCNKS